MDKSRTKTGIPTLATSTRFSINRINRLSDLKSPWKQIWEGGKFIDLNRVLPKLLQVKPLLRLGSSLRSTVTPADNDTISSVENVDISERLTRFENPEDIKYLVGIAGC